MTTSVMDPVMDWARADRIGLFEAVYGAGKTTGQVEAIVSSAMAEGHRLLLTCLVPEKYAALSSRLQLALDFDPVSQTAILGPLPLPARSDVAIVTGGMADLPVAAEAMRTLLFAGVGGECIGDVGVAGLWRLMQRLESIRRARVVIAVAGMEGALFSVLGGLVSAPIIAVPTAVGRGVAADGSVALSSALASCAPGLVTVNINNGFGAAQAALRILRCAGAGGGDTDHA